MEKGKVQTNDHGNNILVETDSSENRHMSGLDFTVECNKMTDEEIIAAYEKHKPTSITIEEMKNHLRKIEGFAHSDCTGSYFSYTDLFTFKRI
jgi:hypothetical protein